MRRKDLVTGGLLIVIGGLFLAVNLELMPSMNIARLWPVVLVVIGLGQLVAPGDEGRFGGVTLLLTAAIFLAHNYHVVRLHDSWPMFIAVAGLSVIFGSRRSGIGAKP